MSLNSDCKFAYSLHYIPTLIPSHNHDQCSWFFHLRLFLRLSVKSIDLMLQHPTWHNGNGRRYRVKKDVLRVYCEKNVMQSPCSHPIICIPLWRCATQVVLGNWCSYLNYFKWKENNKKFICQKGLSLAIWTKLWVLFILILYGTWEFGFGGRLLPFCLFWCCCWPMELLLSVNCVGWWDVKIPTCKTKPKGIFFIRIESK